MYRRSMIKDPKDLPWLIALVALSMMGMMESKDPPLPDGIEGDGVGGSLVVQMTSSAKALVDGREVDGAMINALAAKQRRAGVTVMLDPALIHPGVKVLLDGIDASRFEQAIGIQ